MTYFKTKLLIVLNKLLHSDISSKKTIIIKVLFSFANILFAPIGFLMFLLIRVIRPVVLIRMQILPSERLGHFAGNTELYLCEIDEGINRPKQSYIDIWYNNWPVCNKQLNRMIKRVLQVWPAFLLSSTCYFNRKFSGGDIHTIGFNGAHDRDIHNLLDKGPSHFIFTEAEEKRGIVGLKDFGISPDQKFICLNVRDDAYLNSNLPWWNWSFHNYRNCNIQNYCEAALALAEMGYFVVRMGAKVREPMNVSHPRIIDYAAMGLRTDFMDVYLGANCFFAVSNGTGFDSIPFIFRRPIVYVDHVPIGIIATFSKKFISTMKKHWSREKKRYLKFREIFEMNAGYRMSSREDGLGIGVDLHESSPEEIKAVLMEMEARLTGTWVPDVIDDELQSRFWKTFQFYDEGHKMHGEIRSRIGADYLKRNQNLLD